MAKRPSPRKAAAPAKKAKATRPTGRSRSARSTIGIHGARVHNLKNISLEIPRDQLVVVTGLSGSGKSSLAFDTLYAEGQRRYMESLSTYAKRFISQVEKPDVDFVHGLSPVISIEQKTVARNPRSTVGTLTDIASYLTLLFATIGEAVCPRTGEKTPARTVQQILESLLSLPDGTEVRLLAPVFHLFGEELDVLFTEVRKKGCRHIIVDGEEHDLADDLALNEYDVTNLDVVVDTFIISPEVEKQLKAGIDHTLLVGDSLMSVEIVKGTSKAAAARFQKSFGSKTHGLVYGDIIPDFFVFNNPESACRTCGGIGTHKVTHPDLLVPDPTRSIREGCFVREAFRYNPDTWYGYLMYTLSKDYKFSLDDAWESLADKKKNVILHGTKGKAVKLKIPEDAKNRREGWLKREFHFAGVATNIERSYRRYRQKDVAQSGMEAWLDKVMTEQICPECDGARLRPTRLCFSVNGKSIFEFGQMHFDELRPFLDRVKPKGKGADAGTQILNELRKRLDLLLGIGLDYLTFNRASSTLSGGESQRIRLSTQIGSGLMGMLYVLDEPSIGLHPKDNVKMIETLRSLRDIGNTVVVVEHDEATIRAADHIIEMGPGPGIHGGEIVVEGKLSKVLADRKSPTGRYLSGREKIIPPSERRSPNGNSLTVHGARANNLKNIKVEFPLGIFTCITGASGSGKSTLVNEILYKRLWKNIVDTRTLAGEHDRIDGIDQVTRVVSIDQSPIGRNSRSNPATYIGFYDNIRTLFASREESKARGYKPGRFSFNVKGGRCEECQGEGIVRTRLYFMPDVEVTCATCKGKRYNAETLEVTYNGKTIADILDMSIEEGVGFFEDVTGVGPKIEVLNDLGLGYITLGQSATTLSGGEAQRVKLASELSRLQRRGHVLYILDEPTTGLHLADIQRLLDCLHRLVDAGHTVIVIEHHLDVIKTADHIIDLGPEGGRGGGEVIVTGTPETVAKCRRSYTGQFLKQHL